MTSLKLDVTEISQVGEARRMAVSLAQNLGFNDTETGRVAIVASEAASNLARYAQRGEILLRSLEPEQLRGIELLAVDYGPGMDNVAESLRDGFSTSDSIGIGLGAIARQSDFFDLYSLPGKGTVLLSRVWFENTTSRRTDMLRTELSLTNPANPPVEIGAVCLPAPGQIISGDAWAVDFQTLNDRILIVDGLGHGELAAAAAREAIRQFHANRELGPAAFLEHVHSALRSTRGAVMAIVELDTQQQAVRFCGIGNISGTIYSENLTHGLVSYEGIVGHTAYRFREFSYPYHPETPSLLVLHSDGLGTHWNLSSYPGLVNKHPSLIAGVLYRDFKRTNDDLTVVVVRLNE